MNSQSFDLTLEQQFEVQRMRAEMQGMSHDQVTQQLLEVARLLMVKDNLIRSLLKGAVL
ncbi:MAG: NblA/ycf18 family protein [Leptolyngbyaceae cyanobacterium bins.59]|nr:NblA/ycf18 family protein [Leptolyngbyaceae cyanobacterium bins.59]